MLRPSKSLLLYYVALHFVSVSITCNDFTSTFLKGFLLKGENFVTAHNVSIWEKKEWKIFADAK